jgi:hypothetical protein
MNENIEIKQEVVREADSSGHAVIHCHAKLEDVGDCLITQDSYAVNMRTLIANACIADTTSGVRRIGVKADVAGSGVSLSATRFRGFAAYCDDGGVQIATGNSVCAIEGRTVITFSHGNVDMSIGGIEGHAKLGAGITAGSNGCKYGLWGYFETVGTGAVSNLCCGVMAMIDVDSTSNVVAGNVPAALYIKSNDISGSRNSTGKVVCIRADAPGAGSWDAFLSIPQASGMAVANTHLLNAGTTSSTLSNIIPILVGGTLGYIPVLAAVPAA